MRRTFIGGMAEGFATLTFAVDTGDCCVQPKARIPSRGCNLRAMSKDIETQEIWRG